TIWRMTWDLFRCWSKIDRLAPEPECSGRGRPHHQQSCHQVPSGLEWPRNPHSRGPDVVPTVFVPVPHQRCIGPCRRFLLPSPDTLLTRFRSASETDVTLP